MLDFVSLDEVVPLMLLTAVVGFVGSQGCGKTEWRWAGRIGFLAFIAYGIARWAEWTPDGPSGFATRAFRSLLAAGLAGAVATVVLPVLTHAGKGVAAMFPERPKPVSEPAVKPAEVPKPDPPAPPPPPPPPTPEEQAAAAKQKYDAKLALLAAAGLDPSERHAAGEKAKQDYLKELDALLR